MCSDKSNQNPNQPPARHPAKRRPTQRTSSVPREAQRRTAGVKHSTVPPQAAGPNVRAPPSSVARSSTLMIRTVTSNAQAPESQTQAVTVPKPCNFLDVPLEIFLNIFEYLPIDQTLQVLPLVCKRFQNVVHDDRVHIVERAAGREISRLDRYLQGFYDYKGLPLLTALRHWIERRVLWTRDIIETTALFAEWYTTCQAVAAEEYEDAFETIGLYAIALLELHFAEHHLYGTIFHRDYKRHSRESIVSVEKFKHIFTRPEARYIIIDGSEDHDMKKVRADASYLDVGRIYGLQDMLERHIDGNTSVSSWPGVGRLHKYLTTHRLFGQPHVAGMCQSRPGRLEKYFKCLHCRATSSHTVPVTDGQRI